MKKLLPSPMAAKMLGIKPQTLRTKRVQGTGPEYVRFGNGKGSRVYYDLEVLERYVNEHTFTSTSDESVRALN